MVTIVATAILLLVGGRSAGSTCRVANGTFVVNGRVVRHAAIFTEPAPPPDFAFPHDTTRFAARMCRLESVWLMLPLDFEHVDHVVDSLAGLVRATAGPPMQLRGRDPYIRCLRAWLVEDLHVETR